LFIVSHGCVLPFCQRRQRVLDLRASRVGLPLNSYLFRFRFFGKHLVGESEPVSVWPD